MEGSREESLDLLLAQVCKLHHYLVRKHLRGLGLYRGQPPLLHLLWQQDGRTHKELSKGLRLQPPTVTKMVQRMEKAGFLLRAPDREDERVSRVYLTEQGRAVRANIERFWSRMERTVFEGFAEREMQQLGGFLARMRDNLFGAYDLESGRNVFTLQ
jgi:DNA-binding MarR family transcriptional regulator